MYTLAKPLPAQLLEHVIIYLEEQLYAQALGLLYALAVNQHGGPSQAHSPFAYVPPPHILALLATLIVHPTLSTRANSPDKLAAADQSLIILQHVNQLVGAAGAQFDTAFSFTQQHGLAGGRKLNKRQLAKAAEDAKHGGEESRTDMHKVNVTLANEGGLFAKAEDFWHLVGWSFNCSSKYHKRWARWKLWLSFHLDTLEDDLEARLHPPEISDDPEGQSIEPLSGALVMQYLQTIGDGASRTTRRRAMRAIFAHGEAKDLIEFPEVFRNELKEPKRADTVDEVRARTHVNLDEGDFGDYFDDEDDEDEVNDAATPGKMLTPNEPRSSRRKATDATPTEGEGDSMLDDITKDDETSISDAWGGPDALHLRYRMLVLLSKVASHLPTAFMDLQELLDIYTEFIRPLSIQVFAEITAPPVGLVKTSFTPEVYASLAQMLFQSLLGPIKAPRLQYLQIPSQKDIQEKYLPGVAASVTPTDNAKVSLLVEGMLRLVWNSAGGLEARLGFKSDLEWGIEMRRAKAANVSSTAKKIRVRDEDEEAKAWLASSEARLALIGESIERSSTAG